MLRTTSSLIVNEFIPTSEGSIEEVDGGNRVDKANIVDKASIIDKTNMKSLESRIGFLIPRTRLTFTKLKQAFIIAPFLYHFDLEYHIWIETDVLGYTIYGVLS